MKEHIQNCDARMKKAVKNLEDEYATLRTGRASPALFDKLRVDYYGTPTPLAQVANISTPEARLVVITPWDKGVMGEIEKAIFKSDLGLNPSNDGKVIRIQIPPLTEERRKDLVKHAKAMAEQGRVALRNIRRDGNEDLKKLLKDSIIAEDEEKKGNDEIQKLTDRHVAEIDQLFKTKEKEIMEV